MIDIKISNHKESQAIYEESMNKRFYNELFGWIRQPQESAFYTKLIKKQDQLKRLLTQLSQQQQIEWSEHIFLKIKQLSVSSNNRTIDELLQKLYLLTKLASKFNLPVNHKDLHQILKQTYYEVYKDKIIPLFKKCQFNIQEFKVFQYQDPWYTRFFKTLFW